LTGHLLIVSLKQNKNIILAGGSVINRLIFFSFLFAATLVFVGNSIAANSSNCITCHTNESMMKILHKPPPMPEAEGEG
jgi:hypothetical protein